MKHCFDEPDVHAHVVRHEEENYDVADLLVVMMVPMVPMVMVIPQTATSIEFARMPWGMAASGAGGK